MLRYFWFLQLYNVDVRLLIPFRYTIIRDKIYTEIVRSFAYVVHEEWTGSIIPFSTITSRHFHAIFASTWSVHPVVRLARCPVAYSRKLRMISMNKNIEPRVILNKKINFLRVRQRRPVNPFPDVVLVEVMQTYPYALSQGILHVRPYVKLITCYIDRCEYSSIG